MINRRSFIKKSTASLAGAFMVAPLAKDGIIQFLDKNQPDEWTLINGLELSITSPNSTYSQTDGMITVTKNSGNWYEDVFMDNSWGGLNKSGHELMARNILAANKL